MNLRVGSVSTGIGGDAVAWHPLEWESVFFSEIDAFPSAVLAERYPDVPNLGDFTAADFCERARACGPIDVFAGGTPCQGFSVAGKRGSLDDDRSNLTLRFVEVVHELNAAIVVWENVPGVLSTEDNAFGCFLGGMVGADTALIPCDDCGSHYAKRYWRTRVQEGKPTESWRYPVWPDYGMVAGPKRSLAWRILDAQHFGLAQRRRRVCVVSFRTRDGIYPGAVLFEPESLRRDSPPSRETGQGVAGTLAAGAHPSGFNGQDAAKGNIVAHALRGRANASHREDSDNYVAHALMGHHGRNAGEDNYVAHTLRAEGFDASEDGTGRGTPIVPIGFDPRQDPNSTPDLSEPLDRQSPGKAVVYQCHGSNVGPMGELRKGNGNETGGVPFVAFNIHAKGSNAKKREAIPTEVARCVDGAGLTSGQGGTVVAFSSKDHGADAGDVAPTLRAMPHDTSHANGGGQVAVAFHTDGRDAQVREIASSVLASDARLSNQVHGVIESDLRVRRLAPRECERLQGFPDNWTLIPWRKKPAENCPDGPRYKALGNAWATHVFRWIGRRIELVLEASGALKKMRRKRRKRKRLQTSG